MVRCPRFWQDTVRQSTVFINYSFGIAYQCLMTKYNVTYCYIWKRTLKTTCCCDLRLLNVIVTIWMNFKFFLKWIEYVHMHVFHTWVIRPNWGCIQSSTSGTNLQFTIGTIWRQWYHGTNSYQETINGFWHVKVIDLTIVTNGRLMETSIYYW